MDPRTQKDRHTAVTELRNDIEQVIDAVVQRLAAVDDAAARQNGKIDDFMAAHRYDIKATKQHWAIAMAHFEETIRRLVAEESAHRLQLANEQRTYVDRADFRIEDRLNRFVHMTVWERFLWALFGVQPR